MKWMNVSASDGTNYQVLQDSDQVNHAMVTANPCLAGGRLRYVWATKVVCLGGAEPTMNHAKEKALEALMFIGTQSLVPCEVQDN